MSQQLLNVILQESISIEDVQDDEAQAIGWFDTVIVEETDYLVGKILGLLVFLVQASGKRLSDIRSRDLMKRLEAYLFNRSDIEQFVFLKDLHTLFGHVQVQGKCLLALLELC